ncbi:MAG: cell envelope integrity protein TolA [Pseudomonadota bacterium]
MPSAADRIEFGPPRDAGSVRAFGLALLAHALLIAALTWGVNWKRADQSVAFEAEIWSSVPQAAAPKLVEPPPPPPAPPPEPAPRAPEVKAPPPPAPDVDIALEQEKKRKLLQQKKEREELQAKKEKEQKEKEQKAKEEQAKKLDAQQEAKKLEAKKLEDQKLAKQRDDKQAQASTAKQRDEALKRMMGLAGATGAADSAGTAQKSGGPSASYGGKVRAKVKPNIVFTEDAAGNPTAEVEVRTTPDGTIISQRLVKPSGNAAWDDAVIKAIIRTSSMPRDVDGRVPTPMILSFKPKD